MSYMRHGWFWRYEFKKWRERTLQWIAWRIPEELAYWIAIRVNMRATTRDFPTRTPYEVSITDALAAWHSGMEKPSS